MLIHSQNVRQLNRMTPDTLLKYCADRLQKDQNASLREEPSTNDRLQDTVIRVIDNNYKYDDFNKQFCDTLEELVPQEIDKSYKSDNLQKFQNKEILVLLLLLSAVFVYIVKN
jgi:hypothetical protein